MENVVAYCPPTAVWLSRSCFDPSRWPSCSQSSRRNILSFTVAYLTSVRGCRCRGVSAVAGLAVIVAPAANQVFPEFPRRCRCQRQSVKSQPFQPTETEPESPAMWSSRSRRARPRCRCRVAPRTLSRRICGSHPRRRTRCHCPGHESCCCQWRDGLCGLPKSLGCRPDMRASFIAALDDPRQDLPQMVRLLLGERRRGRNLCADPFNSACSLSGCFCFLLRALDCRHDVCS